MKTVFVAVAILAASVSADTSTGCAASSILDACLETTEGYLSLCGSQDFSCLCEKYTTIMTCFANCPNDDRQYSIDGQRQLYCTNASAFATTTTTATSATKTSAANPSQTDSSGAATTTFGGSADETTSGSAAHATGDMTDAAGVVQPGAGLLAALAGVAVAALL